MTFTSQLHRRVQIKLPLRNEGISPPNCCPMSRCSVDFLWSEVIFRRRRWGPGRAPPRTRSPLAEGSPAATSPRHPSPSPPPPAARHFCHQFLPLAPPAAGPCSSDSPCRRRGRTEAPRCPGRRPARPPRRSGGGCPARASGGRARCCLSTRPRSAAPSTAGSPPGTGPAGAQTVGGPHHHPGACRSSGH